MLLKPNPPYRRYNHYLPLLFCLLSCKPAPALPQSAPAPPSAPFTATVEVDSTQMKVASPDDVRETLQGAKADIIPLSSHLTPSGAEPTPADWFQWGRFSNRISPVALTLDATAPLDGLRAYAPRSLEGTTLLIVNRSERTAKILVRFKATAGFYRLEHLFYTPPKSASDKKDSAPQSALLSLAGVELAKMGVFQRVIKLDGGQVSLVRFTELGSLTRRAYQSAISLLGGMSDAGEAGRLRAILREGEPYLAGVQAGGSASQRAKRYKCFQRLLLSYNQAQSRVRNYLQQNRVQQSVGKQINAALERFENGLGEIGGLEAGLIAYLRVTQGRDDPAMPGMHAYTAIVTLAHGGAHGVQSVALDLDRKSLPDGVLCIPSEPETFALLSPSQTVSVTFHLRVPNERLFSPRQCVGDVAFRFSDTSLHLFPQTW